MARLKNIEKVAAALGGKMDRFSDNSQSWVALEDENHTICICFDGKGEKFEHISVGKKIYAIVDETLIAKVKSKTP